MQRLKEFENEGIKKTTLKRKFRDDDYNDHYISEIISYEKSHVYKHRVKHLTHIVQNDGEIKNPKKQKIDNRYRN